MTAKEKALQLCVKFFKPSVFEYEEKQYLVDEENAKQCALICVDEILDLQLELAHDDNVVNIEEFYIEVKQEINKL